MKETLIVLDYLPNGHPTDSRPLHLKEPLIQGIVMKTLVLLELIPVEDFEPKVQDKLTVQDKDKIKKVKSRINFDRLTHGAKVELKYAIETIIDEREEDFVDFFNTATPITTRQHSLELLPGVGKKHMWDILKVRKGKKFESFEDLKSRIRLLPDPKKSLRKRIIKELEDPDRYYLFVKPPKKVQRRRRRY